MLSDSTIKHICETRLEGKSPVEGEPRIGGVPGVTGFYFFELKHLQDCIRVRLSLDVRGGFYDDMKLRVNSEFELKPNCSKREVLNELDEIAEAVRIARLESKWKPAMHSGMATLPGTGVRGRWTHVAGEKPNG